MRTHTYLLLAIVGLCLCVVYGCAATAHTFGLATTDDIAAEHEDQASVDHAIIDSTATAEQAPYLHSVVDKASERSRVRTAPVPIPTDWAGIAGVIVGGVAAAVAALAHQRTTATQRSLKETDEWVAETEKKVEKVA